MHEPSQKKPPKACWTLWKCALCTTFLTHQRLRSLTLTADQTLGTWNLHLKTHHCHSRWYIHLQPSMGRIWHTKDRATNSCLPFPMTTHLPYWSYCHWDNCIEPEVADTVPATTMLATSASCMHLLSLSCHQSHSRHWTTCNTNQDLP